MPRVAALQFSCQESVAANIECAEEWVRRAAAEGAELVLLPELFSSRYFCKDQDPVHFDLAESFSDSPLLARMSLLAAKLKVVLPVSFYERAEPVFFNSLAMIDADGSCLGRYRKSHIPDGPGYQEKFYFSPGDSGFRVWQTAVGRVGPAICWDQWFPEAARCLALQGAEILLYPTAIGSEPQDSSLDSRDHWQVVMRGHAGANLTPLIAANRVGTERGESCELKFYGSSFIAGATGNILAEASCDGEEMLIADIDFEQCRKVRSAWGVFRDRRPDLYQSLSTLDGDIRHPYILKFTK